MVHTKPSSKNPPPPSTQPFPLIHTNPTPPPTQPPPPTQKEPTPIPSQPLSMTLKKPTPPLTQPPPPTQKKPTPITSQTPSMTQKKPTPPLTQPPPPTQKKPTPIPSKHPSMTQKKLTPPPTDQPQSPTPTSEEFRFIPTPGYTHHVLQCPPHHNTDEDVQEEGDQALSNEEQQEQDDGEKPKIYIMEDTNALSPDGLVTKMCKIIIENLYRGTFYNYSELKCDKRKKERREWFNTFKSLVCWDRCDDAKMEELFHQRCATRLRDILQKARTKARKPPWMGVDTWEFLLDK